MDVLVLLLAGHWSLPLHGLEGDANGWVTINCPPPLALSTFYCRRPVAGGSETG